MASWPTYILCVQAASKQWCLTCGTPAVAKVQLPACDYSGYAESCHFTTPGQPQFGDHCSQTKQKKKTHLPLYPSFPCNCFVTYRNPNDQEETKKVLPHHRLVMKKVQVCEVIYCNRNLAFTILSVMGVRAQLSPSQN